MLPNIPCDKDKAEAELETLAVDPPPNTDFPVPIAWGREVAIDILAIEGARADVKAEELKVESLLFTNEIVACDCAQVTVCKLLSDGIKDKVGEASFLIDARDTLGSLFSVSGFEGAENPEFIVEGLLAEFAEVNPNLLDPKV